MSPETLEIDKVLFEHRQQVNYWQSMHARAGDREALWKQKAQELEALVRGQAVQLQEQAGQFEALTAKVCQLQQQVFPSVPILVRQLPFVN